MLKRTTSIATLVVCVFVLFALAQRRSLRQASLIDGMSALKVAYSDYTVRGYPTSLCASAWCIWPFTNIISIDGTQYQCFAKVGGGYGYGACTLAMTTNHVFIWLDPERPAKTITAGTRPDIFSWRY